MEWTKVGAVFCLLLAVGVAQDCDVVAGWREHEGSCYYLSTATQSWTWHRAYDYCRQQGGHLASVHDREEMNFIVEVADSLGYTDDMWIGGTDLDDRDGKFVWTDNTLFAWVDWGPSQPDTASGYYCIYSGSSGPRGCFARQVNTTRIEGVIDDPYVIPDGCLKLGSWITPDDVNECERRCGMESECDVYTYIHNHHPDPRWYGECFGCDFKTIGQRVHDQYSTSGEWYECPPGGPSALWYSANCGINKRFMCKKDAGSDTPINPTPTTTVPGHCPEGWIDAGAKCFKIVNLGYENGISWQEARDNCKEETFGIAPDLASVANDDDTAILVSAMQDYAWGGWIGLTNVGTDWLWTDNSDTAYQNWSPTRPGYHNCVELITKPAGSWSDLSCEDKRGYVCQIHKDPNNPLPSPPTTPNSCPAGYTPYWYACYRLDTDPRNWQSAEQECEQDGGHLVSIHTAAENSWNWHFIRQSGANFPVFLGLEQNQYDEFVWTDGWWNRYINWNVDNPGHAQHACTVMDSDGKWNVSSCTNQYPFICKTTTVPPVTTPGDFPGTCPSGWTSYGNKCYYLTSGWESWEDAVDRCQEHAPEWDVILASIHDHATNQFLSDNANYRAWIGLSKTGLGEPWTWMDGTAADFFRWAPGEPNDEDGTQLCVEMYADSEHFPGTWNDHDCDDTFGYICQTDKRPSK